MKKNTTSGKFNEKRPRYSVVVPVYESSHSVIELVARLQKVMENEIKSPYEIILIDDGSKSPSTWETLKTLSYDKHYVVAIRLMRNYGKASAILCGLSQAKGSWIITIDDDLQQRPEDIPELLKYETHDVVVANYVERKHAIITVFTSWIKSQFDRMILKLPCKMSPLKVFKSEVARGMLQTQTTRPFIPALLAHSTSDFVSVVVRHDKSQHGVSRYSFWKRVKQFSNLLIGNSSLVLRCTGLFGGVFAVLGFAYAFYIIVRKIVNPAIEPGWTSLVAINLVFGGLILIVLGIIGEYLIRILEGSSSKPPFIVRESIDSTNDSTNSAVQ